jgi:hypothetical protein
MSLFADIELLITVLKEVDSFMKTVPLSDEAKAIMVRLEQALSVVAAFGL